MEKALEVDNLVKRHGNFVLDNVSFYVNQGSITGFLGVNGAGKTTTLKAILGQIVPDSGIVKFFGKEFCKENELSIKNDIGVVFDNSPFYGHLTIKEMTKIVASMYKQWNKERYYDLLDKFTLVESKKINELSKGMKMKYSIALALSHQAKMLIMDEPTSGLDPFVRESLNNILYELSKENISVFYSTHITSDLDKVADHIIIINNGKILSSMDIDQNRKDSKPNKTIEEIMLELIKEDESETNNPISKKRFYYN